MVQRQELLSYTNDYLSIEQFDDYCPNGLQVEGSQNISRIVSGVTACELLIDAAIVQQAQAILVHHGYFWRGEQQPVVGIKRNRIAKLLEHNISLLAYHLPLDRHAVVGNNARLAQQMGWCIDDRCTVKSALPLVCTTTLDEPIAGGQLADQLNRVLDRQALHIEVERPISRIAWCTGAAQSYLADAVQLGVDAFVSGEISEQTVHEAREYGIHYFAAGHHATERYGVQALGEHLASHFGIAHEFVDIQNPV